MRNTARAALFFGLAWATPARSELVDPTTPPEARVVAGQPEASAADLVLTSILLSSSRRLAVINGRTVREGDFIGPTEVLEIAAEGVRLRRPGGAFLLSWSAGPIKLPTASQDGLTQ